MINIFYEYFYYSDVVKGKPGIGHYSGSVAVVQYKIQSGVTNFLQRFWEGKE